MGSFGCVCCEKFRCDFMAQTCALIAPVQPILHQVSCSNETLKDTQTLRNAQKHEFRVQWGGSGVFIAKNFEAILCHELLHLLHQFNPFCTEFCAIMKQIQNAPKQYETHKYYSLVSNGSDWVCSLQKIPMRLHGINLCLNCTSSTRFVTSFVYY